MIRLSAFADEISPDLDEQIGVLQSENISYLDLRGVWNTNVLDLTDSQVSEVKRRLDAAGIKVAAIGSPIGKVPIDADVYEHLQRFERAIELALAFETRFVRIFSFYPPAQSSGEPPNPTSFRDDVLARLSAFTARAGLVGITLIHENEKDIYGDTIDRCVDLMRSLDDDYFQAVLDPANFIQCGQTPYPDGYEALRSWVRYVHVKDALGDGGVVPAGQGAGRWPDLLQSLRDDGYDGFFSLEPHLAAAGQFTGFSGPDLFRQASQALKGLLRAMDWDFA